jgi:predicted ATPase
MTPSHSARPALIELRAENFLSLRHVAVRLGPLNVLVGPNGAGKSNLLDVVGFLGDSVREDLGPALDKRGGFERVQFRGKRSEELVRIHISANVTRYSSPTAPDEYDLSFRTLPGFQRADDGSLGRRVNLLRRWESFQFKRLKGPGRRITINGSKLQVADPGVERSSVRLLRQDSLGLSTLPRLATEEGGGEVRRMAELFESFRVFDVNVRSARAPSYLEEGGTLDHDASNLAAFLLGLSHDEELFGDLQEDARAFIPGLKRLVFRSVGGPDEAVAVELEEHGLAETTTLREASFGTVRALAILAMLYDPDPPALTCVEEIDHGLHPYVFERLVERLRDASNRTQFLIATHSPALVNRLDASELIVCERDDDTGASRIPAIDANKVAAMAERFGDELGLGEIWFTGTLGGVPG